MRAGQLLYRVSQWSINNNQNVKSLGLMLGHFQRYVIKYAAPLTVAELAAAARHKLLMQLPGKRGIGPLLPQEEKIDVPTLAACSMCTYYKLKSLTRV